jgi:hypothetical protein
MSSQMMIVCQCFTEGEYNIIECLEAYIIPRVPLSIESSMLHLQVIDDCQTGDECDQRSDKDQDCLYVTEVDRPSYAVTLF